MISTPKNYFRQELINVLQYYSCILPNFLVPSRKEVSLGENNKRILYLSEENELQVISQFKECGGKILNPLYYPPTERNITDYTENKQENIAIIQMAKNLYSKVLSLINSPIPQETSLVSCSLSHCAFNNDGSKMAVCFPDNFVRIYNLKNQQWESVKLYEKNQQNIHSICWKPDSYNTLAIGCQNGVYVWSFSDCVFYRVISSMSCILSVNYSPCGQ